MKVKQLMWDDGEFRMRASTPFGFDYVLRASIFGKWYSCVETTHSDCTYCVELASGETENEVKAAAQADFERRVLECLEPD